MKIDALKKTIVVFLACLLLAGALPCLTGCARHKHIVVETRRVEDYYFSIYEDGTADLTRYTGSKEVLKLPRTVGNNTVVGFGTKAFDGCEELKQVLIPPSVKSLPAKLFNNCPALESVYIPASVKSIGKNVISECPAFTTVLYEGSQEQWSAINVGSVPWTDNYSLINAEIVCDYELK